MFAVRAGPLLLLAELAPIGTFPYLAFAAVGECGWGTVGQQSIGDRMDGWMVTYDERCMSEHA